MATSDHIAYVHSIGIAADHPAFAGHFPGMPILPGAVLLDEVLRIIERDLGIDLTQWQLASAKSSAKHVGLDQVGNPQQQRSRSILLFVGGAARTDPPLDLSSRRLPR